MEEIDLLDLDSEESVLTDEVLQRLAATASGCLLCELDALQQDDSDEA